LSRALPSQIGNIKQILKENQGDCMAFTAASSIPYGWNKLVKIRKDSSGFLVPEAQNNSQ